MRIFHLILITTIVVAVTTAAEDKNRGKRQQISYYGRRGSRPPPYAVQMEPIVQYSQRDPLYNPLASSKSDDVLYHDDKIHNYYGSSDPEPIIEIIIKESNETLPPSPTPTYAPVKPTKEPIQVFYVKYEKKDQGNGKSKVVYDKPVPALTPHEEHEEIKNDNALTSVDKEPELAYVTPATTEPTTTLRAIIRPDSEIYHAPGGSGLKVTFGTDQLPPNNHKKRSDRDNLTSNHPSFSNAFSSVPPTASKRQHGPFPPSPNHHRVPAFGQQRIVNSFPPQQHLPPPPQLPPNFSPTPQFQSPPPILNGPRPQRPPITIQGLPEVQQRLPFQSFPPHRISISHPQQPGFPPAISVSHQSVHLQNQPPLLHSNNFNGDQIHQHQHQQIPQQQQQLIFKQQESEKQKYHEQRRQQDVLKQREQHRQAEIQRQEQHRQAELQRQEQQKQAELQRQEQQQRQIEFQRQEQQERERFQERQRLQQLEQQRLKQEKYRQEQQQQQQHHQQQQHQQQQQQHFGSQPIGFSNQPVGSLPTRIQQQQHQQYQHQQQQQQHQEQQKPAEILKAVPKLEQHYAIRENPQHPGPFPPSPQFAPLQYPQNTQDSFPSRQQSNSVSVQKQTLLSNPGSFVKPSQQPQLSSPAPKYQNVLSNQQYFGQSNYQSHNGFSHSPSIWGQSKTSDKHKIFATPVPKNENVIVSSTPRYVTVSTTPSPTTPTTTTATPPSSSPRNEERIKENIANLPDEVPDDIREQLLSSGILGNADIQVLDYDKIGDTPLENLPPEALANFYGAGGGGAVAASAPVPSVAKKPKIVGDSVNPNKAGATKVEQATLRPGGVEMKVVHFDPNTAQGQAIADQHIREDATHLKPVTVGSGDDAQYNRYLPLKVSGTSFPIPDVPELKDRKISSVVVLAPVDYNFREDEQSRNSKKIGEPMPVRFLAGDTLKQLIKKPSAENFKTWLEHESQTEPQKQSVILLITTLKQHVNAEREIYMYDVSTQTVSKLSGDLSSAFVDAAESNSESPDSIDDTSFTS